MISDGNTDGPDSPKPDSPKLPDVETPEKTNRRGSMNFKLPTLGEAEEEEEKKAEDEETGEIRQTSCESLPRVRKVYNFAENMPANLPSAEGLLGHIRLLEE